MSDLFEYHKLNSVDDEVNVSVHDAAEELEATIAVRCKPSREKSLAMTKLEECVMWANKSLALYGSWDGEQ